MPACIRLVAGNGAALYAGNASVDMFDVTGRAGVQALEGLFSVEAFRQLAAGGQIIST